MRYSVANVEVVLGVADVGGPRGAEPPRGARERSEAERRAPLGGSTAILAAPLPPCAPLPTDPSWGSRGPPGPLAANRRRAWCGAPSGAGRGPDV